MRFTVGEVWKSSVEASGGEPRRAVIVALDDDGRGGTLFLDNGDQQSVLWPELTQAGKWQVDTSPRPTRSADDLKQMMLRQIQRGPVCPAGMSVEIRNTSGSDWEAEAVPPPGLRIAYSVCASYISELAIKFRWLYGVRITPVEAKFVLPVRSTNPDDDVASAVVRMTAERQRRSIAALQAGPTDPIAPGVLVPAAQSGASEPTTPSVLVSPEPSASTAPSTTELTARASTQRKRKAPARTGIGKAVARNSNQIVLSADSLLLFLDEKIASLGRERPNSPETTAARDQEIERFEEMKRGLEAFRGATLAFVAGKIDERAAVESTKTFADGIRAWWTKDHDEICGGGFKMALFVAGVAVCSLAGAGGQLSVAITAALVGGKPIVDALKALGKRSFKPD